MNTRNPLVLLADKFQADDPKLTREDAFVKAGAELKLLSSKPLTATAKYARDLKRRADALVKAGKSPIDAVVQAYDELRLESARAGAKAALARGTGPRSAA